MREIKFRAWDIENEKIIKNYAHVSKSGQFYTAWTSNDRDRKYIPMQSTGLKDKNGVEIYEGDIIVFDSLPKVKVYIEWRKENAGFHFGDWYENCFPYTNTDATIIGNIYENPELLDKD